MKIFISSIFLLQIYLSIIRSHINALLGCIENGIENGCIDRFAVERPGSFLLGH
jgi:hypothetical protein